MDPWHNWIVHLTTDEEVVGSNQAQRGNQEKQFKSEQIKKFAFLFPLVPGLRG